MGKKITLVIPGSVAASRAVTTLNKAHVGLIDHLVSAEFDVSAIVTRTLIKWGEPSWGEPFFDRVRQAANGISVVSSNTSPQQNDLIKGADKVIIFPATADIIGQINYSAFTSPPLIRSLADAIDHLVIVPAMNAKMWAHVAVQRNCLGVLEKGAFIIGPTQGKAEATTHFELMYPGFGRIMDTDKVAEYVEQTFNGGGKQILEDYYEARRAALARWQALSEMSRPPRNLSVLALVTGGERLNFERIQNFHNAMRSEGASITYVLDSEARTYQDAVRNLPENPPVYDRMSQEREHIKLSEKAGSILVPFATNNVLHRMLEGRGNTLGDSIYLASLVSQSPVILNRPDDKSFDQCLVDAVVQDGVIVSLEEPNFANLRRIFSAPQNVLVN